jgi:glycine/D-amino acid oxidase-like deaminating enzyme
VLLERAELTAGTTWQAAGLIVSGFSTETDMHMAKYTRDLFERLGEETGRDTGFRANGYMQVASNPERLYSLLQAETARNVRRSAMHNRLAAAGAYFGQSVGWEYPPRKRR